jgi:hypothetical protein
MALTPIIETDSGSGLDITSAQTIGSYSPSAARMIGARVKLSSLNGTAATFTAAIIDSSGYALASYSMAKFGAGDLVAYLPFDPLLVLAAETVSISILSSNASDTSVTWAIEWIDAHRIAVSEMDTDVLVAAAIKADAVTKIQAGLATASAVAAIPTTPMRGTDNANTTKTGYALSSAGLDQISAAEPTAKPTTFPRWIMWLVQIARRSKLTRQKLTVQKESDGSTISEQDVTDDNTTQTLGPPTF